MGRCKERKAGRRFGKVVIVWVGGMYVVGRGRRAAVSGGETGEVGMKVMW
jgi:hypothetical protein